MKKIVLIALVLLVTVGCADKLITEEIAIQKAYYLVQQDCLKSPDYSWHSLPISAYSAKWDKDTYRWLVDVGPNPHFIKVYEGGNEGIYVPWASDGSVGYFKREYLEHCHNVYPWDSEGRRLK